MTMTKREKQTALIVALIAACAGIYTWVISPYFDVLSAQASDLQTLQGQYADDKLLLAKQGHLKPVWAQLQAGGLFANDTEAESQALHAAVNWALSAGLDVTALSSPRSVKNGEFQVISFRIEATGPMRSVDKLLWALENATIPMRVTDVEVDSAKEGTDALKTEIGISTLSWNSAAAQPAKGTP